MIECSVKVNSTQKCACDNKAAPGAVLGELCIPHEMPIINMHLHDVFALSGPRSLSASSDTDAEWRIKCKYLRNSSCGLRVRAQCDSGSLGQARNIHAIKPPSPAHHGHTAACSRVRFRAASHSAPLQNGGRRFANTAQSRQRITL